MRQKLTTLFFYSYSNKYNSKSYAKQNVYIYIKINQVSLEPLPLAAVPLINMPKFNSPSVNSQAAKGMKKFFVAIEQNCCV